jgi:hypothetical protein
MKKTSYFKAFFAFMALTLMTASVQASATTDLYPALTDSVSWNMASLTTDISGNVGSFQHYYQFQVVGDTLVQYGPTASYNVNTLQRVLYNLPANKTINVYSVVIDQGDTSVSNMISFTTKPLPHAAWLGSPSIITSPSQTVVTVPYNLSVPTKLFVRYGSYTYSSDTAIQNGTGTAQLLITNPNVPGTTYSGNVLRAKPVTAGIVADTFITLNSFTVPVWTNPDVANNLVFTAVTQDSFKFTATITKGNSATATVTVRDLDSNGAVVVTRTPITIHNDTSITWTRSGTPATNYGERVIVITSGGSDSTTGYKTTAQIPAPQVIGFDTINGTKNSTDITVTVKTNGKPAWVTSDATVKLKWFDKNGVATTTAAQSTPGSSTTATLTFTGLTNLKMNPNQNTAMVYIQNLAGLVDSQQINFVLKAPLAAVPIDNGWYIDAINAYSIKVTHVNAGPSTLPFKLKMFINVQGSGNVDTLSLRINQTGTTDYLQKDTVGNRTGGVNYQVRLATENSDGVFAVTSMQPITTLPAANQTFFLSNAYTATESTVTYKVMGCGNGKPTYVDIQAFLPGSFTNPVYSQSLGYQGTGNFSLSGTITGLDACTDYVVRALIHDGSYGGELTDEANVATKCTTTGINEVGLVWLDLFPNPAIERITLLASEPLKLVSIYSLDGKQVFSENFSGVRAEINVAAFAPGTYIVRGNRFDSLTFIKQ